MLAQSPVFEGKFVIKVDSWDGLLSDEFLHPGPTSAIDMTNFDIKNESGRSFIQQRQGFVNVGAAAGATGCIPAAVTEIRGLYVSQLNGDSERVVIAAKGGNESIWAKTSDDVWREVMTGAGADTSGEFCTFVEFKDTLIVTGANRVFKFYSDGSGFSMVTADPFGIDTTRYTRMFLHQDRIYGYGDRDSADTKLVWWPEFSINFDALPDTVPGGGYAYIGKDDGDFLTNMLPQQSHIIAYKSRSIYKIMVSPSTNAPNEIVKITSNIGAYGYDCVSEWNGNHYFVAENGVYEFDGVNVTKLSDPINYWFADSLCQSTGRAKIFKTCVVGNRLYVTLPLRKSSAETAEVGDGRHFVYDLDLKIWMKYDFTGSNANRNNESHFLTRYEYSPACTSPIIAGINYGQKLLFVIDSADQAQRDKIYMFPVGWKDRNIDSIHASWTGAFFPVVDLYQRFQLERVMAFGSVGATQDARMDIYSANDFIISGGGSTGAMDSAITLPLVPSGSTGITCLTNTRLSNVNQGSLLRYRIRTYGGAAKINRLEFVGSLKGLAEE